MSGPQDPSKDKVGSPPGGQDRPDEREPYDPPRLTDWGPIGDLTLGGVGGANDGADSASGNNGFEV